MMKVFAGAIQFVLFLVVFAVFSFFPPLRIEHVVGTSADGTRIFIWDGLLIATLFFALVLCVEAALRRLARAGIWTFAAFLLAMLVGLAIKLGFKTNPGI